MTCDEVFYRQYLSGDDAGLEALMKKYGDPLTLYIDGYLHDVHEAEELMQFSLFPLNSSSSLISQLSLLSVQNRKALPRYR